MQNNIYNPYQQLQLQQMQQLQNLQQRMQPQQQVTMPKITQVANEDVAMNTPIEFDGNPSYFVYGNTILARSWNVAGGCVVNRKYILQDDVIDTPEKQDDLKTILEKLDEINKKITPQIKKKEAKDE